MRTITSLAVAAAMLTLAGVSAAPAGAEEDIYVTEFSDPAKVAVEWGFPDGETQVSDGGVTAAFEPGVFTITLDGAANTWFSPDFGRNGIPRLPADQAIEARVSSSSGDASALFGVECRTNFGSTRTTGYGFVVGLDGYYTIAEFRNGRYARLANTKGTKRTDLVDPEGPNIVKGTCVGKKKVTLTLSVNGETVASVVDTSPAKAGTQATVTTEVAEGKQSTTEFIGFAAHGV